LPGRPVADLALHHGRKGNDNWSSTCRTCPLKAQCTPATQRRIKRWEHEAVIDAMQQRLDHDLDKSRIRRQTVEHPFGALKA